MSNMDTKKKIFWSLLAVALAALSIWAVLSQSKKLSLGHLVDMVTESNPLWLVCGVLCMCGFIFFEAQAILCIIKSIGYKRSQGQGLVYSASDIYFSAITPSATGGQPASAYFMMKDGIPGVTVTAALLVNLVMYTLAILFIGAICVILDAGVFIRFSPLSKALIIFGYIALIALAVVFYLLLRKRKWVYSIGCAGYALLGKFHLIRNVEDRKRALARKMTDYKNSVNIMTGKPGMLVKVFLFNLLQRASQITVTLMMYMATGGRPEEMLDIWVTQSFTVLGSNCIPIPGAMGVSDYLLLDGLGTMMGGDMAIQLELLSRSLSFYSCVIISAIIVVVGYMMEKKKTEK